MAGEIDLYALFRQQVEELNSLGSGRAGDDEGTVARMNALRDLRADNPEHTLRYDAELAAELAGALALTDEDTVAQSAVVEEAPAARWPQRPMLTGKY